MATIRGGDRAKRYLEDMNANFARKKTLRVGFLGGATEASGTSVALVAAVQEFGSATIPPRPFFRNMVAAKKGEWAQDLVGFLGATDKRSESAVALERLGEKIRGQLQQSILETNEPALKPATVARKGFAKPLVDTGTMLDSVDYEVE